MQKTKKSKKGCAASFFITLAVLIAVTIFIGLIGGFLYLRTIPSLEELTPSEIAETSKVYALDGTLLTEFHAGENRELVPFDKISEHMKNAIIAVEDKRFYDHTGVDYKRIIGAAIADIKSGKKEQGASTITMQYVKNVYFSPEKTFRRKINEAIIAIQLERNYTKDKILEMYLNTIPFGSGAYGIEKAAQIYFGIHASELDIAQSALLAGIVRGPNIYNPFVNMEEAELRRNIVLKLMYDQEMITKDEYLDALASPIVTNQESKNADVSSQNRTAPYFIDFIKQEIYEKKFTDRDVFKGGLRIYTTLDLNLQKNAEEAVKKIFPQDPGPSYGLISVDPGNGYIYALIGGKDYSQNQYNVVSQGKRQPGSIFKVPVLMESIRQHLSPNDKYNPNGPITIDMPSGPDWQVENYGNERFDTDEMTVVDATIHSVNVVYAQLMMKVGAENVEKLLNEMDIAEIGSNPAIALGGLEKGVSPLDVSKIFSTLAANGVYKEPICILKITDSSGDILYEYEPASEEKVIIDGPSAYYTTKILERTINEGTGRGANIGRPAAGKTGTTSDYRDAWFGGYTPELATVVWMGHLESNTPMEPIEGRSLVGGSFPADIWREFMIAALKDKPVSQFTAPEGELVDVQVCLDSELLPTFWCPEESLGYMIFVKGEEPAEFCNIHNKVTVPDVVGMNIDEARKTLEDLYFLIDTEEEYDETYNEDIVFKTSPEPETVLESLTGEPLGITLYVSKGLETFKLPDLTGAKKDNAVKILESLNIEDIEIVYDFSDTQPADKVFAQEPEAKAKVNKNTEVTLYISKGENPEGTIPGVIGLNESEALEKLESSGFKNVKVETEESDKEINKVFSQSPESGLDYPKTGEVLIKISLGIKVPDVINMEKDDAVDILESLGFIINILPDSTATGIIKEQSPEKNTYLNYGSAVEITIEVIESPETPESPETSETSETSD